MHPYLHFRIHFKTEVTENFKWKIAFKLISTIFLRKKYARFFYNNQVTKILALKMV